MSESMIMEKYYAYLESRQEDTEAAEYQNLACYNSLFGPLVRHTKSKAEHFFDIEHSLK